jgi:hypothetical protein
LEVWGRPLAAANVGLAALFLALAPPVAAVGDTGDGDNPPEVGQAFRPTIVEKSAMDSSVTIGLELTRKGTEKPALSLRGNSISREEPSAFRVDTHIARIPCPGEYRFDAAEEDSSNGNSSTYSALIRLLSFSAHPADSRCGASLPPLPGRMSIYLQDRVEAFFAVQGARSNAGPFKGPLSFNGVPQCDRDYRLETELDLARWSRSVDFKVKVIQIDVTLQGKSIESKRC